MKNLKPDEFISLLRNSDKFIKEIYSCGGCWQFYKILKALYPDAIPYKVMSDIWCKDFDHIVSEIKGNYYDIEGNVNHKYFGRAKVEENDIPEFESWSFAKNHCFGLECPNCGEMVG
jgi:hypothetical protein